MQWKSAEQAAFSGGSASSGQPNFVESMQLLDRNGNVVITFTKAVDGSNALAVGALAQSTILGVTSQKAETTTADANVLTVTPPAAAGTYRIKVVISVASATSGVISWTLSYKDSNANAQTNVAQQLFQQGTAAPNVTFTTSAAGNYFGEAVIDVDASATPIIVKWVGGGTTSAKMSATIERII